MDITKLSEVELKAMIFDEDMKIKNAQANIDLLLKQLKIVLESKSLPKEETVV
jgi:hypothetical protein